MQSKKQLIMGVLAALIAAWALTVTGVSELRGGREVPSRWGVGLMLDSRWVGVEGYCSTRNPGATARDQAWAGGAPFRDDVRFVRVGAVPNLVGRTRESLRIMRVLSRTASTVARHLVRLALDAVAVTTPEASAATEETGDRDADRR